VHVGNSKRTLQTGENERNFLFERTGDGALGSDFRKDSRSGQKKPPTNLIADPRLATKEEKQNNNNKKETIGFRRFAVTRISNCNIMLFGTTFV